MKLTEINLIGEGKQLKDYLFMYHSGMNFPEYFGLYNTTFNQYLSLAVIKNERFIKKVETLVGKEYKRIIHSVSKQVNTYVIRVKENIKQYTDIRDIEVISELHKLAAKNSDQYHILISKANLGIYKFNIGNTSEAVEILGQVLKECLNSNFEGLYVYYTVQLAYMHINDYKSCMALLEEVDFLVESCNIEEQYTYYYFYGAALNRYKKTAQAREKLYLALDLAPSDDQAAKAMLNIGLSYKLDSKKKFALEWYRKALYKSKSKDIESAALNNIANLYCDYDETDKALHFINKALKNLPLISDIERKASIIDTYLSINSGNAHTLIDDLISLLNNSILVKENVDFLVSSFKKLTNSLSNNEHLNKLLDNLLSFCNTAGDNRIILEIKGVTLDVLLKIKRNEGEL